MSEYLSKKAVLEWLNENIKDQDWPYEIRYAFKHVREKIQSGAFDADESEGTWKATSEFAFRLNDQLEAENQRLRAALAGIVTSYRGRLRSETWEEIAKEMVDIAEKALSTTSEPTGAERAKAAIADRYKNALHGWHNPVDRAAGSYYNGYLNGVGDTLRLLDITIPGINAPEGDRNDA